MRALVFDRFGGPDVLSLREVPDPVPSASQALVRMSAIGLNFADVYRRNGNYHLAGQPPFILGYEGAGVVESAPAGSPFAAGDRVAFADSPFANAELVAVDVDRLVNIPPSITFATAAASMLQGLTAQYLVNDSHVVKSGELVVVHSAGGGVGLLLVQLAVRAGARVFAIASSEEKRAAAIRAGASIAAEAKNFAKLVRAFNASGADVVYDSVGTTLHESLAAARIGGAVVFYGFAGGDPPPVDARKLMDKSLTLTGGDLWNVLTSAAERRRRAAELFALIESGDLRVDIAKQFALADGAVAHRFLESRAAIGKILLVP
jgi:NADPH2:quinone reductase